MALSGTRLKTTLAADILTQLQTKYPPNSSLLPAEQALLATSLSNLATALANAVGPDVVTEITTNAVVPVGIVVATTGTATAQAGATTSTGTVL